MVPFPYLNQRKRAELEGNMKDWSGETFHELANYVNCISPDRFKRSRLLDYFQERGIRTPQEAMGVLIKKLAGEDDGDSLCLVRDIMRKYGLGSRDVKEFLSLSESELEMRIPVYMQDTSICVEQRYSPLVGEAASRIAGKNHEEPRFRYAKLPEGVPCNNLNREILPRLGITPLDMTGILEKHPELRNMIYRRSSGDPMRVVKECEVGEFTAAVQGTEEYRSRLARRYRASPAHQTQ
jgi:hypothetical protein